VQIARLLFAVEVGDPEKPPQDLGAALRRVGSAFASYASEDRAAVLQWRRGAALAGVDVLVDVLSLREGQDWERALREEVASRDLFCLFWSAPASRSAWVEREWRSALAARSLDYIHPVPLADPRDVPPPKELAGSKHFNDLARVVIDYERARQAGRAGVDAALPAPWPSLRLPPPAGWQAATLLFPFPNAPP
jgi:hypothetical protein